MSSNIPVNKADTKYYYFSGTYHDSHDNVVYRMSGGGPIEIDRMRVQFGKGGEWMEVVRDDQHVEGDMIKNVRGEDVKTEVHQDKAATADAKFKTEPAAEL